MQVAETACSGLLFVKPISQRFLDIWREASVFDESILHCFNISHICINTIVKPNSTKCTAVQLSFLVLATSVLGGAMCESFHKQPSLNEGACLLPTDLHTSLLTKRTTLSHTYQEKSGLWHIVEKVRGIHINSLERAAAQAKSMTFIIYTRKQELRKVSKFWIKLENISNKKVHNLTPSKAETEGFLKKATCQCIHTAILVKILRTFRKSL